MQVYTHIRYKVVYSFTREIFDKDGNLLSTNYGTEYKRTFDSLDKAIDFLDELTQKYDNEIPEEIPLTGNYMSKRINGCSHVVEEIKRDYYL